MTEKRYFINSEQNIEDKVSGVILCDFSQIADQLNEYDERFYQLFTEHSKLQVKNKWLKQENKHLRRIVESNNQLDHIDYLEKQNERLKERIAELSSNDKIVFMNGQDYEIF